MKITAAMVKELRDLSGAGMSACKNALTEADGDIKRAVEILREKGLAAAAKKAGRVAAEGLVQVAISQDCKKGAIVEVNSETDFVAKNEDFISFVKQVAKQVLASDCTDVDTLLDEQWLDDNSMTVKDVLTGKIATIGENIGIRRFARYDAENGIIIDYIHGGGRIGVIIELSANDINDNIIEAGKNICMQIAAMSPQFVAKGDVPQERIAKEKEFLTQMVMKEGKPEKIATKMVEGRMDKLFFKEICLLEQDYVKDDGLTIGGYIDTVSKATGQTVSIKRFTRFEKGEGIEKKEENFAEEVSKAMNI